MASAAEERILLWNAGAEALFGYSTEEALALPLYQLVPPELRDTHRTAIAHYARTGEGNVIRSESVVEVVALRRDGGRIPVELRLSAVDNPEGDADRHVLAIIRDVTDRKAAENSRVGAAVRDSRRSDALELHDDILQELVIGKMAFDLGDVARAEQALDVALAKARRIVATRLDELENENGIPPGSLRRDRPA